MSYVGNVPTTAAFPFDQFSGNGSTTAFTLSYAPAGTTSIIVSISGVVQNPNTYSVSGTTLTFTPAPPTGSNNIAVLYLGLPVVATLSPGNTAYFSSSVFTATQGQTVFTPSGTYQTGFINVIRNGAQLAPANYTATNGTTVTLANACTAGDIVVIEVFNLTSIAGALPVTGGTVTGATTFNSGVNLATSSGNVGIGTSSPNFNAVNGTVCHINNSTAGAWAVNHYTNGTTGSTATDGLLVGNIAGDAYVFNYENTPIIFGTNNSERMRIDSSGGLILAGSTAQKATGTTWSNPSDQRLKNNIQDYTKGTTELMQVRVREWEYNGKGGTTEGTKGLGVIADEVMSVLPNTVENYEAKLNVDDEETTEIKKFDATEITWLLVKAVQEQQAMIEELKTKVAALEGAAE